MTDMKLEIVVIPVSDVDRAKAFYTKLGWRVGDDIVNGDNFRAVQLTPPNSAVRSRLAKEYGRQARLVPWRPDRLRYRGGGFANAISN